MIPNEVISFQVYLIFSDVLTIQLMSTHNAADSVNRFPEEIPLIGHHILILGTSNDSCRQKPPVLLLYTKSPLLSVA